MNASETSNIKIVVNGQKREAPGGFSLDSLLGWLEIDPSRVAVELDGAIVRRGNWGDTQIQDGATLEVVQFVGGG